MQQVVTHLRDYWFAGHITTQDKKELLRCLVERVLVNGREDIIRVEVYWYGGARSELDIPKHLLTSPHIYYRIRELAHEHTDHEIAEHLNQVGHKTVTGQTWQAKYVTRFRRTHAIGSAFSPEQTLRLNDAVYITSAEAARRLGEPQSTIQRWCRLGILDSKQDGPDTRYWVWWHEDVRYRFSGDAISDPRMVSVRSLCATQGKQRPEVLAWTRSHGYTIYRLQRGSRKRFYLLPPTASESQT